MLRNEAGPPRHRGPAKASSGQVDPCIITDPRVRMRGRLHRFGTIERAVFLYGEVALLPPTPAGPAECPPWCEYCQRWAVVA
jgi:hypothetical protein